LTVQKGGRETTLIGEGLDLLKERGRRVENALTRERESSIPPRAKCSRVKGRESSRNGGWQEGRSFNCHSRGRERVLKKKGKV